jgi:hypothetical protein
MNYNKLTFGDIMQSKILYYDPDLEEACLDICNTLHIDNMPAIDGRNYYERNKNKFKKLIIEPKHLLYVDENIFDLHLINKFRSNKHNVLFVFEGSVIKGIVHICDYNQDVVIQAIQDDILVFERNLRQWLILNGFNNKHMLEFYDHMIKTDLKGRDHWESRLKYAQNKEKEMKSFSEFQLFEFSDLIEFANSEKSKRCFLLQAPDFAGSRYLGKEVLKNLRNLAMHGKNPVKFISGSDIYHIGSLENLFNQLDYFKHQLSRLMLLIRNHDDYIKSIRMDNKNKLQIIHDHHPKAIWYFIGK